MSLFWILYRSKVSSVHVKGQTVKILIGIAYNPHLSIGCNKNTSGADVGV